jgi:MraZ protein
MRIFTGQHERNIDNKNRVQLPQEFRTAVNPEHDGKGWYVTLGHYRHTLSLYTARTFEERAAGMKTEDMSDEEAMRFELQYFGLAAFVESDKQGRIILPDRLKEKAKLGKDVYVVGQKIRIDLWNRDEFDQALGIDWKGDEWPEQWRRYVRGGQAVQNGSRSEGTPG